MPVQDLDLVLPTMIVVVLQLDLDDITGNATMDDFEDSVQRQNLALLQQMACLHVVAMVIISRQGAGRKRDHRSHRRDHQKRSKYRLDMSFIVHGVHREATILTAT